MFSKKSYAIIYGLQLNTAQKMLDFDFLSERDSSIICFINPSKRKESHKLFFGDKEILFLSYPDFASIPKNDLKKANTLLNFASFRSAYDATLKAMEYNNFKNIVIIAEGMPERQTREIIALNKKKKINIIGPATVGGIVNGEFRLGNTGGSLSNIISSKLYKKGVVGIISKSGGMSNELRKIVSNNTSGVHSSFAIGGDKYSISGFIKIIKEYEKNNEIKMIVLLGEIGGNEENEISEMIKKGVIKKPIVAYCIGTISDSFGQEIQFGHAGAKVNKKTESASYKNNNLKKAGAIVPSNFMYLGEKIKETFKKLNIKTPKENDTEIIKKKLDIINKRKKTKITSTISDERSEELRYNKKNISFYSKKGSIANVISNLWLKRDLPEYGIDFINQAIILLADHGPAVSGATNAIITARGGNDLKSSLISSIATIGPRFGGAIDEAGKNFFNAISLGLSPKEFVDNIKKQGLYIPGIGHKIKSKFNPDKRCEILSKLEKKFPVKTYYKFGKEVEKLTLEKKFNLILNVDGVIACMMLDMFKDIKMSDEEIKNYIDSGILNGLFILSRSIGFIGHIIDQKMLKEPLYRTDWDDILYI